MILLDLFDLNFSIMIIFHNSQTSLGNETLSKFTTLNKARKLHSISMKTNVAHVMLFSVFFFQTDVTYGIAKYAKRN